LFIQDNQDIVDDLNQTADSLPIRLGGRWIDNDDSFSSIPISVLFDLANASLDKVRFLSRSNIETRAP